MNGKSIPADRDQLAHTLFTDKLKARLRVLITEDLIEEHRRQPLGQHGDALERVLNFFRTPPRYALYSSKPCREYRVIKLPIVGGRPPHPIDDEIYTDENEAMHAGGGGGILEAHRRLVEGRVSAIDKAYITGYCDRLSVQAGRGLSASC